MPVSIFLTVVALVIVGIIKGMLASLSLVRSILELVAVGAASAGGGYLLGVVIPRLFGYKTGRCSWEGVRQGVRRWCVGSASVN